MHFRHRQLGNMPKNMFPHVEGTAAGFDTVSVENYRPKSAAHPTRRTCTSARNVADAMRRDGASGAAKVEFELTLEETVTLPPPPLLPKLAGHVPRTQNPGHASEANISVGLSVSGQIVGRLGAGRCLLGCI